MFEDLAVHVSIPKISGSKVGPFEEYTEEQEEFKIGLQDSYEIGNEDSVPDYDPLYYSILEVDMIGEGTATHPEKGLGVAAILEYTEDLKVDLKFEIEDSIVLLNDVPLMLEEDHDKSNNFSCLRAGGHFDVGTKQCITFQLLSKVCIKVDFDEETDKWVLNKTEDVQLSPRTDFAGVGCFDSDSKALLYKKLYMSQ